MLNETEQLQFMDLLRRIADSDDMAIMNISNKANELITLIEEL